jgi:hypothetical protein
MLYYKEIDIPHYDSIVQKSLEFIKSNEIVYFRKKSSASFYVLDVKSYLNAVPEVRLSFLKYNLICNFVAAYVMYNSMHTAIHTDEGTRKARINLPLLNCDNTFTNFYSGGELQEYINPDTGMISRQPLRINGVRLEATIEIKKATVVRISELHKVILPKKNPIPRITLSLGFDKDPVFLLDENINI